MKTLPLLLFIAFHSLAVCSQQRIGNFMAYSMENGLSQNTYHDVFESSDGYLWLGSNSGLFRFDGKRFQQISSLYYNSNTPGDNNILGFAEDNDGNLWMAGFRSGLTKYNLKTGAFRQYKRLSSDSTETYGTSCIYKDDKGTLWIGTAGRGLAMYLPERDTFRLFYPDPLKATDGSSRGENEVTGIKEDNKNKDILWLSCFDGLYSFNKKTSAFTYYPCSLTVPEARTISSFLCIEQAGNLLYLGTWYEGLVIFDKTTAQFKRVAYKNPVRDPYTYIVADLQITADSLLYIASMDEGLLTCNINTAIISPVLTQADVNHLNTGIGIIRVSLTMHAGLFAGGNSGIYQSHPGYNRFTKLVNYTGKKIYPGGEIYLNAVAHDAKRNGYWFALFNQSGLTFMPDDFSTQQVFSTTNNKDRWYTDVAVAADHSVWASDNTGELYFFDPQEKMMTPANKEKGTITLPAGYQVIEIESDRNGDIWLAGNKEAFHFTIRDKKLSRYSLPLEKIYHHSKNGIRSLVLKTDSKSNAWMATNAGLLKLDAGSKQVDYYFDTLSNHQFLASGNIKSITIDKNDKLWLGYYNEGIQVLNTNTLAIDKVFTTESGLPGMEINYLDCDNRNNILACLSNGLAIYKPSVESWQIINGRDGLRRDYLDVPVFTQANGSVILDQVYNFLVFNLDSLWNTKDSIITHITSLKVNGKIYPAPTIPDYFTSIQLGSHTKDIHIEFAAANWQFPFRTKYFYRVDGIHKSGDWISVDEAMINLTGLSSGDYTFRFYAITADGIKTTERELRISIRPPFYKTWWFLLLCLLLVSGILYSVYKYRINQLKKVQGMRNSISRDLHDDVGATMTSISILSEVASQKVQQQQTTEAHEMMEQIGTSSRQLLQNLDDIIWSINPQNDPISRIVLRMKELAAEMMELNKIAYRLDFDQQLDDIIIPMQNRRHLFLIYKEALHNMVKYARCTNAVLSMHILNHQLLLTIEDDGIGFDPGAIIPGNGLVNMQQRAAEMKAELVISSTAGKGTTISLRYPLKK